MNGDAQDETPFLLAVLFNPLVDIGEESSWSWALREAIYWYTMKLV